MRSRILETEHGTDRSRRRRVRRPGWDRRLLRADLRSARRQDRGTSGRGYLGNTGFALHETGHAPPHTGIRVSEDERAAIKKRLDEEGTESWERDHGIAIGLFFEDPEGRLIEAITYSGVA
jgi:hypothetical protein